MRVIPGAQIGARRDVHDLGARQHGARRLLRQRGDRQQVDVEGAAVVVARHVEERALVEHAGVVHQRGQRWQRPRQFARGRLVGEVHDAMVDVQSPVGQRP